MISNPDISAFSGHLFWDVDAKKLSLEKNKKLIVQRVLEYGLLDDWLLLRKHMSIMEIAHVARDLRSLDDRALAFISSMSKIPKDQFLCYTTKRSIPKHWSF